MHAFRILTQALTAGVILAALAACGPTTSRGGSATGQTTVESDVAGSSAPQSGGPAPKGRIITLTDSMLVHGGTDTIRFGRLGSGEIAVQRFHLENASANPVVLVSTQRSCGCISLDQEARPIAPGEFRKMEMTFDTRGEYGWQLKRMDLLFAGSRSPLRIFVEADVE